ncbi:LD-carboxypeptidase [Arenibacter sp. GZD96]|nr:LD-carboxypeptidase [Arenibacter sp. GZD-96]MEA1784983.1 LD-carboxypeptidase [Arenibacter sp. GZD-96]
MRASALPSMDMIQPNRLVPGDTVAIVAPSGVLHNRKEEIQKAEALLKGWGLHVVVGKHVFKQHGHFAGTDAERAEDFQNAMDNPNIKAIWCARGGYGTVRILDLLDYTQLKQHPKWLLGYSDITALHNQFHNLGVETIHAMMCTSLSDDPEEIQYTIDTFKDAIFGEPLAYTLKGSPYNKPGTVSGPLVGGNLTLLHTMLGSDTSIDISGKILFIEEIGEYAYHIDRMLQSLKRAGYFENCKGIVVGDITKVRKNTTEFGRTIEEIILDAVADYDFPVAFNMPAGHEKDNRALILGRTVQLLVTKDKASLSF